MSHALHFVTQLSQNTCFVLNWYLLGYKLRTWHVLSSSLPLSYLLNHNSILSNLNCMWDLTSNCEYFRAEKLFKCFKPGSKLSSTFQLLVLDIRMWNIIGINGYTIISVSNINKFCNEMWLRNYNDKGNLVWKLYIIIHINYQKPQ